MEERKLSKKWKHLKEFKYIKTLINHNQDIFLLGPSKSGKTELIKDLTKKNKKSIIKINCLMFSSMTKIRSKIVHEIYKFAAASEKKELLKNYRTFIQLENYLKNSELSLPNLNLILIIENAESLYKYSKNAEIKKFFEKNRLHFKNIVSGGDDINVQTIILSTLKIPIINFSFFQFGLYFPDEESIFEHNLEYLEKKLEKDGNLKMKNFLDKDILKNEFLSDVNCFNIFIRDFWSFEILIDKLYFIIQMIINQSKVHENLQSLSKLTKYSNLKKLIQKDFSFAFEQNNELINITENLGKKENNIFEKTIIDFNPENDLINDLPFLPKVLLLAFGLATENPKTHDHTIFIKINEHKKQKKNFTRKKNYRKKNLNVNLSRVIAITEIFLERKKDDIKTLDFSRIYHSTEFFLNIDFLEKIKLIKFINIKNNELYYKYLGNMELIEKLLDSLGQKKSEFLLNNN